MAFYPKAPVVVNIVKLDKATVAAAMITDVTLKIITPNWSGRNFADTQTTVAGTPTVTRNTGDVTLTMSAGDDITGVVVRRN